tara:strand:+ start:3593 stop:3826 length:234 start_codon:yes stop_codon:yes gene_type:complete
MANPEQQQELSPEQTADLVNRLLAENKTYKEIVQDTANKIANLELRNSELKVQNNALNQVLNDIGAQKTAPTQAEEE